MTTTYAARFRRDDNATWLAEALDGDATIAASFGRTIRSARTNLVEALAVLLDVEPSRIVLQPEAFELGDLSDEAGRVLSERRELRTAEQQNLAATRDVAWRLVREHGLSLRDVAEILDCSHQRIQQLVDAHGGGRGGR
jgi:predicted RNase H-like HicB family nuclease